MKRAASDISLTEPDLARPPDYFTRWLAVGLAFLAFGVYAVSLRSGFVYDAAVQIQEDDYIHTPSHLLDVITFRVMSQDVLDFNRPVHLFVLMIDSLIWDRNPIGYHLTSILLHTASTVLLFLILRRWLASELPIPAAIAAAVFAMHPVCTEAVAEPSYREDVLSCFFLMAAIWLAQRWAGSWRGRSAWPAVGVLACVVGALGSKEIGVAAMPLLAIYWWIDWRRAHAVAQAGDQRIAVNRQHAADANKAAQPAGSTRSWLILLAIAAALTAAFVLARFALAPTNSHVFEEKATYLGGSFAAAIQIQPRIWTFYLWHFLWPFNLCADYMGYNLAGIEPWLGWTTLAVILLAQLLAAWRSRLMLMSAVLFWTTLLPASNLLPMFRPAADRYCYLPMTGVAFAIAAGLAWCWRFSLVRGPLVTIAGLALIGLIVLNVQRQAVFANSLALWKDTIAKNPTSYTAADNLGWALMDAGDLDGALQWFGRSVNMTQQHFADPYAGAALALEASRRHPQADAAARKAISLNADYTDPVALRRSMLLTRRQIGQWQPILDRVNASR